MKRPYVIINCAMSADGKIALPSWKQLRISSEEDIQRVYQLRNDCDAVLVGINTILSDNPKLTVKKTYVTNPKQPLRVVLDTHLQTPADALVRNTTAQTLIITADTTTKTIHDDHIQIAHCKTDQQGYLELTQVLHILTQHGITKLLVEGGSTIIWNFLKHQLVDDLYLYMGSCIIGGTQTPTLAGGPGITTPKELIPLTLKNTQRLGDGVLLHYQMKP